MSRAFYFLHTGLPLLRKYALRRRHSYARQMRRQGTRIAGDERRASGLRASASTFGGGRAHFRARARHSPMAERLISAPIYRRADASDFSGHFA